MRFLNALALGTATSTALAARLPRDENAGKFLIETAPGETRWVTKGEKVQLAKDHVGFFDITGATDQVLRPASDFNKVAYPTKMEHQDAVNPLFEGLSTSSMEEDLTHFASYDSRTHDSQNGVDSANWLLEQINKTLTDAGAQGATVQKVEHDFQQPSIVANIPGQSDKIVVVGAHQDSVNGEDESGKAPGADDNGSGSITILEALRALLKSEEVTQGNAANGIEFHWYAGEEAGLLGSQDIFTQYKGDGKNVVAMLNQDMTGYIQATLDAGEPEHFGLISDNIDEPLTEFTGLVIDEYCKIPYQKTECGYACSDHASAVRNGYPAAFVFEASFDYSNPDIHTARDTMDKVNFDHMLEHAKLVVGFMYELGFATL